MRNFDYHKAEWYHTPKLMFRRELGNRLAFLWRSVVWVLVTLLLVMWPFTTLTLLSGRFDMTGRTWLHLCYFASRDLWYVSTGRSWARLWISPSENCIWVDRNIPERPDKCDWCRTLNAPQYQPGMRNWKRPESWSSRVEESLKRNLYKSWTLSRCTEFSSVRQT